jgi:hypothetical protein
LDCGSSSSRFGLARLGGEIGWERIKSGSFATAVQNGFAAARNKFGIALGNIARALARVLRDVFLQLGRFHKVKGNKFPAELGQGAEQFQARR